MKSYISIVFVMLALCLFVSSVSALVVYSVDSDTIAPGQEGELDITIKNTFEFDVEDVSLSLDLTNLPLTTVGSSEYSQDEISEDDRESFVFTIRADATAEAGDYKVPYTLTYKNASAAKKGTIGIRISAKPDLSYTYSIDTPVIGSKAKLNVKIINKGLGEARFAVLRINPVGFTLISESEIYIGSISSDDFETASFDIVFNSKSAELSGELEYKDLENVRSILPIQSTMQVYTQDEAVKQGIIEKSNAGAIIGTIILLLVIWIVWKVIAKKRRIKKSMQSNKA